MTTIHFLAGSSSFPHIDKALLALEQVDVASVVQIEQTDANTWCACIRQEGARDAHVDAWGSTPDEALAKLEAECTDWEFEYEDLKDIR